MFDRCSFDRNPFDRSASFNSIEATLRGFGTMKTGIVVQTYLQPWDMLGRGHISVTPTIQQRMSAALSGYGDMDIQDFILRLKIAPALNGHGTLVPGVAMQVPIGQIDLSGEGDLEDSKMFFLQHMISSLSGHGTLTSSINLRVFMNSALSGSGDLQMDDQFKLLMPVKSSLSGYGDLILRRIGALNSDTLAFEGLNLQPGQSLTIDSDELTVFIGTFEDVSSVTSDSVFFHLQPGENEISFEADGSPNLDVTIIWNNRWL
jgi:hypothetical protein